MDEVFRVYLFNSFTNQNLCTSCEIGLRWVSQKPNDDKSSLVQVIAWYHQATSLHLIQVWLGFMSPYDVTGLQSLSVDKVLLRRYRQGHFYLIFDMSPRGHRWGYMPASSHPYQVTVTLWRSGTWRRNVHSTLLNGLWRLDLLRGTRIKVLVLSTRRCALLLLPPADNYFTHHQQSAQSALVTVYTQKLLQQFITSCSPITIYFQLHPHTLTTVFHIDNYYTPLLSAIILNTNCYNTHNQLQY